MFKLPGLEPKFVTWVRLAAAEAGVGVSSPVKATDSPATTAVHPRSARALTRGGLIVRFIAYSWFGVGTSIIGRTPRRPRSVHRPHCRESVGQWCLGADGNSRSGRKSCVSDG